VDVCCIIKGIVPISFRECGISEHGPDFVKKGSVHPLGHAIVLWHVWGGYFMLDSLVPQVLL
jgi:hypothetical protein